MANEWKRKGSWLEARKAGWVYRVLVGPDDVPTGLVDVHVHSPAGEHFVGTIGTVAEIERLLRSYRDSGECLGGRYFWTSDLVIVQTMDAVEMLHVLTDLASQNELESAFRDVTLDD